jgi:hypothetical protein
MVADFQLSNPTTKPAAPTSPTPSSSKPPMNIDEAIAAEEASLRAIEAYLKPHRENQPQTVERQVSPQRSPTKPLDESPIRASRPSIFIQTPAKTPIREYPHISNSLVNPSEHRPINRFTPLKNIGTPQKRERGSIFGRAAPRSVGRGGRPLMAQLQAVQSVKQPSPTKEVEEREDDTIRIPQEVSPSPIGEEEDDGPTPQASPVKIPSPVLDQGPRTVHGILVDDEGVAAAIVCPHLTPCLYLSLMPRQRSGRLTQIFWATPQVQKKDCKFPCPLPTDPQKPPTNPLNLYPRPNSLRYLLHLLRHNYNIDTNNERINSPLYDIPLGSSLRRFTGTHEPIQGNLWGDNQRKRRGMGGCRCWEDGL